MIKYCRIAKFICFLIQLCSSIQSVDSGTTFWNTTPTFGTPPHRGFWDFLEHHPNFWNTTPSRILGQRFGTTPQHHPIEDSGTTFWSTTPAFGTPPHRGFWDNFWNTTPSTQQREHQPARLGVLVQPLEHRAAGSRPREWDTDGRSPPALGRRKK